MACSKCDNCILISNDCLKIYTPLRGVQLEDIMSCVLLANNFLEALIGTTCFEKLCNGELEAVKKHRILKQLYARLIYKFWLIEYGGGTTSAKGIIVHEGSDGFNDEYRNSSKENDKRIGREETITHGLSTQFATWFNSLKLDCVECKETKPDCNCNCGCNPCECKIEYDNEYAASI